ncbi:hypothetical protein J6590_014604 [Homalodisca vitripennis]|nr:hypothetical protein J6590_014604 [Homalodisca vitripennis]
MWMVSMSTKSHFKQVKIFSQPPPGDDTWMKPLCSSLHRACDAVLSPQFLNGGRLLSHGGDYSLRTLGLLRSQSSPYSRLEHRHRYQLKL